MDERASSGKEVLKASPKDPSMSDEIVKISRSLPLPDVCILTGEVTSKRIRCLFHWKTSLFHAGTGPIQTIIAGIRFYLRDIPKAVLLVPVSDSVYRRRNFAFLLTGVAILATIGTCLSLYLVQKSIDAMPKGVQKKQLNDILIPSIAVGGFGTIAVSALFANRYMPGLTTKLRVEEITESHVRLRGVCKEFRQALERGG
jgi:hypothetical protein